MPTGVSATGYVRSVNVWGLINNGQNPDWNTINNGQTPGWNTINNGQTPGWSQIGGRVAFILTEDGLMIETEDSVPLVTEQTFDLWETINDSQSPNWKNIAA